MGKKSLTRVDPQASTNPATLPPIRATMRLKMAARKEARLFRAAPLLLSVSG